MENIYGPWGNGVDAYLRKDYGLAERNFKSAPPSSKICFNLGMTLMVQSKFQDAIASFNQALEFDDWMAVSYFQRGNCYFMLGQYDLAIQSWNDAKENIRHGEVVDYDSLHLAYMLCKSEIAVNIAIAFYYCDMSDECNAMLDEARRYTIVKDDVVAVTQQMIHGDEIYPCTVDDTTLFNPPKLPQSVIDAMKKGGGGGGGWGSQASSPPPAPMSTPAPSYGKSSYTAPTAPKLAPPARAAPSAPGKKTGGPPFTAAASGPSSNGAGGPPPPPPPPKKPKVGARPKLAAKKAPAKLPAGPPTAASPPTPSVLPPSRPAPIAGAPTASSPTSAPVSFGAGGGGPPGPPPPIPAGGVPQRHIPLSDGNSGGSSSTQSRPPPSGPSGGVVSADALKDALARRNKNGTLGSSGPPSSRLPVSAPSSAPGTLRPAPGGANDSSPGGMKGGAPLSSSSPGGAAKAPSSFKMPAKSPASVKIPPVSSSPPQPNAPPPATSPRHGSPDSVSFKILAEQGARKKKIEVTVTSPSELRAQICQAFEVAADTLVEHFDPDFDEFVELDNAVNLSSLPNMLKVRVQGQ